MTEAVTGGVLWQKVFLEISQNSQENPCASLFSIKLRASGLQLEKKRPWHRCFPVNFAKFLRTSFLQNTFGRLLLRWLTQIPRKTTYNQCTITNNSFHKIIWVAFAFCCFLLFSFKIRTRELWHKRVAANKLRKTPFKVGLSHLRKFLPN